MHFRPRERFAGDIIPFFWQGEYHLFYLPRASEGRHCWGHLVSKDLLEWSELPDALKPSADPKAPDHVGCWTGSVIEHEGRFHIFYTGWNPEGRFPQTICHAVSKDLIHWEKDPENPILVPDERWYEPRDFRDPFVFFNPEAGEFWMLICARHREVAFERRGCVALAVSKDLQNWELREPLWSGSTCWAPECPDMFELGGRWYLVYSHGQTRYRFSGSSGGPWLAGFPDSLDGPFVCAAKTLFDGRRRLLFGWIPTLGGGRDDGPREWGGHMALPRELKPLPDGSLAVSLPEEIARLGASGAEGLLDRRTRPLCGRWTVREGSARAEAPEGAAVLRVDVPSDFLLSAEVLPDGEGVEFGFLLRMADGAGRKVAVGRCSLALYHWASWADPEPSVMRPLCGRPEGPVHVHLVLHGSILEVFVAGRVSLAARLYEPREGWLGLYIANGTAEFRGASLKPLPPLR